MRFHRWILKRIVIDILSMGSYNHINKAVR